MADFRIEQLHGKISGTLVSGRGPCRTGVIILGGSSGRVDIARAQLFTDAGTCALALQWFGGPDQSPGICEIPLETFTEAVDYLLTWGCERIVFVGTSKGAEASLLTATIDPRVSAVVAISPSSVVWGNIGAGTDGVAWPERSSWSHHGRPLDFVPAIPDWHKQYRDGLITYRPFFEECLFASPDSVTRACIPIENAAADIILVAGPDDPLWPSDTFAEQLARRRLAHNPSTTLIIDQDAGHRVLFPGEETPRSKLHAHGTDAADARLGRRAWQALAAIL